jgi:RNA-directed DNA polymerase
VHLNDKFSTETELKEKLKFIFKESQKGKGFSGIHEVAFHEVTITTAIHNIKSNRGSKTAGVDQIKMDKYLQMDKNALIHLIQTKIKIYKPKPVRRVYIPKANGKLRPLGIPTVLDRIIQECLRIILEPIVEAKFYPHSYGFRPLRACKNAISQIINNINTRSPDKPIYAIEGDIKGYFDNINHRILIKKLWKIGVKDTRVLAMIKEMLKAGYIELDKRVEYSDAGTPQGGIISPLLANVYLNDFDWTVGRMYETTKYEGYALINSKRRRLKNDGRIPKYLVRYADDWLILTTTEQEASRLLNYLKRYFNAKLRLELSDEKTVITNITKAPAKFLGFNIIAEKRRLTTDKIQIVVGKNFPNPQKVREQVKVISREIHTVNKFTKAEHRAVQIEKVNAIITGIAEYWKSSMCSQTFKYIDDKVNRAAAAVFKKMFGQAYQSYNIPLNKVSNRPQRHENYTWKSFAIKYNDMWIGFTKAGITHSKWEKYPFNQKITPYTKEGLDIYLKRNLSKKIPLDRPPIYDIPTLIGSTSIDSGRFNFEYFMNREYAFNRDKGKCKICELFLSYGFRQCHHMDSSLPLIMVNKVNNLAWLCTSCHQIVHGYEIPKDMSIKAIKRVEKFKQILLKK